MIRFVKRLVFVVVGLVVLLAAGAFLLPQTVTVERKIEIAATPETVFPHVNSLQKTSEWSPWLERDPDVDLVYSGPESGVGNAMTWASDAPDVGNGRQEVILSVENERVETALDFGDMGTAQAYFDLSPEGAGTVVTWGMLSDAGMNPIGRWMNLMMDRWVGADYERGLARLKALVEGA